MTTPIKYAPIVVSKTAIVGEKKWNGWGEGNDGIVDVITDGRGYLRRGKQGWRVGSLRVDGVIRAFDTFYARDITNDECGRLQWVACVKKSTAMVRVSTVSRHQQAHLEALCPVQIWSSAKSY
jgi:hypothetical protein